MTGRSADIGVSEILPQRVVALLVRDREGGILGPYGRLPTNYSARRTDVQLDRGRVNVAGHDRIFEGPSDRNAEAPAPARTQKKSAHG